MIKADQVNPNYFYPEELREKGEDFFTAYQLEKEVGCPAEKIKGLLDKKSRVCRFCKKKYPLVSFNKDAHIISELLGNKYLVSDYECDDCNWYFSKYENDLANYLGISRTVQSVKAKKTPKFKSADNKLVAESIVDDENQTIVKLKRTDPENHTFFFDSENNQTVISFEKSPYTPLNVFKAFLKIALSLIDEKDLFDYQFAFKYLRTKKHDDEITGFAFVTTYTMPITFQFEQPAGILFRKIDNASNHFTHVFYLSVLNKIFQIVLPFNRKDALIYHTPGGVNAKWCPPLFGHDNESRILSVEMGSMNLNSSDRIYKEKETLIFPVNSGEFNKSRFLNPVTGEIYEEDFDPTKIVGIDLKRINPEK